MTKQKVIDEQRKEIKALNKELSIRKDTIKRVHSQVREKEREIERRQLRNRHLVRQISDMLSGYLSVTAWIPCFDADMGHEIIASLDIYELFEGIDHAEVLKQAFNVKTALEDFYKLMHEDVLVSISLNDWPEGHVPTIEGGSNNG